MAWKQLIKPNHNIGYTGGWCQRAVRQAYGQPGIFATASEAWQGELNKHTDRPPLGLQVPVYFKLEGESAGHVAFTLPDGRVASTSQAGTHKTLFIHPSIDALIRYYSSAYKTTYLGWGEHVSKVRVVQWVADPVPQPTPPKPTPTPTPKPTPTAPKVGDRVYTSATHDAQNGQSLNLAIINDGHSVFSEVNSKGNAVLRRDSDEAIRAAVAVGSLSKI